MTYPLIGISYPFNKHPLNAPVKSIFIVWCWRLNIYILSININLLILILINHLFYLESRCMLGGQGILYEVWHCVGDVGFGAAVPSAKSLHPRSSGARFGRRVAGRDEPTRGHSLKMAIQWILGWPGSGFYTVHCEIWCSKCVPELLPNGFGRMDWTGGRHTSGILGAQCKVPTSDKAKPHITASGMLYLHW